MKATLDKILQTELIICLIFFRCTIVATAGPNNTNSESEKTLPKPPGTTIYMKKPTSVIYYIECSNVCI